MQSSPNGRDCLQGREENINKEPASYNGSGFEVENEAIT